MEEYKTNSYKSREPQKPVEEPRKVEKVVTGPVRVKKKTGAGKFFSTFFTEDWVKIKEFTVSDVLVPTIKKAITDIVTNGINMVMYGADAGRNRTTNGPVTKISYKNYTSYSNNNAGFVRPAARTTYSYDEIIFSNRGEAELVLSQMDEIISKYGFVKVADYYDLVGTSGSYTDNNYGWYDLRPAQVVRLSNGEYTIKLPRALPID